jgi:D-glycero-D-manno-heptose 1,7-bisphosphate phosphatase
VVLKEKNIFGLQSLKSLELKILVASNQRGIGLGLISRDEVDNVNKEINNQLKKFNIQIEKFFYCPHRNLDNCDCRKPKPGLLNAAAQEFNFNLKNSIFIGDMPSDCYAGILADCGTILLSKDRPDQEISEHKNFLGNFPSLLEASETIKKFYLNVNN